MSEIYIPELVRAEARRIPLADRSVPCVVSPPFWGLRKYEGGPDGDWGGTTNQIYVDHTSEIMREIRRTLVQIAEKSENRSISHHGCSKP